MKKKNIYIRNSYLIIIPMVLGLLGLYESFSVKNYYGLIYDILLLGAIIVSVFILISLNKAYAGNASRQNQRLKKALMAGNLTLFTLNLDNMLIEQETPFTFEGEEPKIFDGPVNLDKLIISFIHPNDHHIITGALYEFRYEGVEELNLDLRVKHEKKWLWFRFFVSCDTLDRLVLLGQMIHHEKIENKELYRKANFDALTNLFNRHYCYSYLERILEMNRKKDFPVTIAYIDADALKEVNDQLGHIHGDQYLKDISSTLSVGMRENDILGRIGGDEFLFVCPSTSEEDFKLIQARIEKSLEQFNRDTSRAYKLSFSLGFVEIKNTDNRSLDELLEEADRRMYKVKKKKKSQKQGIGVVR